MHVLEIYDPDLKQSTLEASSESDRTTQLLKASMLQRKF
jgi:hypothetical protein